MSHGELRLIIGITGASGAIYGVKLLEALRNLQVETHLVISKSAGLTLLSETGYSISEVQKLASYSYNDAEIGAAIASGSFKTAGMVVAPCSINTMSAIATGVTSRLIPRAADVVLKERRRLVLMVRETPLHLGHLRTMTALTEMGAVIAPPVPAFYSNPQNLEDMVNHTVGRVLDIFGIDNDLVKRWSGIKASGKVAL